MFMSYRSRAANAAIAAIVATLAVATLVGGFLLLQTGEGARAAQSPGALGPGALAPEAQFGGNGAVDDPSGIAVDADHPGVRGLDPELREAVQAAAASARADGLELRLNSGWRSAAYQAELRADAIAEYGSEEEASHWVDTPERSAHVRGDAVDIGGLEEALWLGQYGAQFGLCQIYANENWHFELATIDADGACPAPYDSAAARPE